MIAANEFHTYFRVNSLFWDPNVLGPLPGARDPAARRRDAVDARERGARWPPRAPAACCSAALVLTFSQSSLVALLAGLVALAALRWGLRWGVAAVAVAALAGLGLVGLSGADVGSEQSLNIRSSGRADLVRGGLDLATNRPLAGYGSGSFQVEFSKRVPGGGRRHRCGVAHRARHGRRRAGAHRPDPLRGAAAGRLRRPARRPAGPHRGARRRSSPASSRWSSTASPTRAC